MKGPFLEPLLLEPLAKYLDGGNRVVLLLLIPGIYMGLFAYVHE